LKIFIITNRIHESKFLKVLGFPQGNLRNTMELKKRNAFVKHLIVLLFLLVSSSSFSMDIDSIAAQDSAKSAIKKTIQNHDKKSIVASVGLKLGAGESSIWNSLYTYSNNKRAPHLAVFARLFEMKYLSQEVELFFSQPQFFGHHINFINIDYAFQVHGTLKGLKPFFELGPALGIYCGGDFLTMNGDPPPKKYTKYLSCGCKWGIGLGYYQWRISPQIELCGVNYLTPFYQSENEGNYIKVTDNVDTILLTMGLSYSL